MSTRYLLRGTVAACVVLSAALALLGALIRDAYVALDRMLTAGD